MNLEKENDGKRDSQSVICARDPVSPDCRILALAAARDFQPASLLPTRTGLVFLRKI
jgi:hypothetical protein